MAEGIGDLYQQETKYRRGHPGSGMVDWSLKPSLYKEYPDSNVVLLPEVRGPKVTLEESLRSRRSVREYSEDAITLDQLSFLVWASAGIREVDRGYEFRTAPSAGALYPIETYVLVNRCKGIQSGLYHYAVRRHYLEEIRLGELGAEVASAALDQSMCAEAAVVFLWSAVFARSKWKYRERAYRYIYLEAGHIAQNLALAAASLGLGSCQIAAFFDDELNKILGIDGTLESVIYLSSVGRPI